MAFVREKGSIHMGFCSTLQWPLNKKRDDDFFSHRSSQKNAGWAPLFDITLQPGDGLFFPPGMVPGRLREGEAG